MRIDKEFILIDENLDNCIRLEVFDGNLKITMNEDASYVLVSPDDAREFVRQLSRFLKQEMAV